MTTIKFGKRLLSLFIVILFTVSLIDTDLFNMEFGYIRASAAKKDYSVGFKWDVSDLVDDKAIYDGNIPEDAKRRVELFDNDKTLKLTEYDSEQPVLKTTFAFNLKKAIEPGKLTFTISGLDDLIRNGTLTMDINDPNLVKTWDIRKDEAKDEYVFTNKVRVTSNNETTFTWQFDSREAINMSDIVLNTSCNVIEVETVQNGEETEEREIPITLDTNSLRFQYESKRDENEVKIVSENIEDLDANNLNVAYEWRSYRSVLGLKGLTEYGTYDKNTNQYSNETNGEYDAHYITQNVSEQKNNMNSRGIRKADYFIEVEIPAGKEGNLDNILVVNSQGEYVKLQTVTINVQGVEKTLYGFYDFKGREDMNRKWGESYSCEYCVGYKNDALEANVPVDVKLTGHFLINYNDESGYIDITDSAANQFNKDEQQHIGNGNWIHKKNKYEVTEESHTPGDGVTYERHSKHPNPQNQLLYNTIFSGKVVTYHLDASSKQVKADEHSAALAYDLIFEDGVPGNRPRIENLDSTPSSRELSTDEYDFVRVKVEKLVDGNTVTGTAADLHGFDFELYGRTGEGDFTLLNDPDGDGKSGNTLEPTEIFLPEGIDEIKIVVRDLNIRTFLDISVDVRYNINESDINNIYIDTVNLSETNGSGKLVRKEDTNKSTRLVNYFRRLQYIRQDNNTVGYDIYHKDENEEHYGYNEANSIFAHSNTWLRDSTTAIDSSVNINQFVFHDGNKDPVTGFTSSDYYSTTITAGGTVKSDSEMGLHRFIVYSKLPDNVSPSKNWLDEVKKSFKFSSVLQGTGEAITEEDVFAENAVSFVYDEVTNTIMAEVNFDSFALKMDELTSCTFSYPAEISLAQVKAEGGASHKFTTTTYVTVLDDNVRLSAVENKHLIPNLIKEYGINKQASTVSNFKIINARGSQKSNEATKQVKSYYNNWVLDNSTTVDGSNTHKLDTKKNRMTSEYTYQMAFYRYTSESDMISNPIMIDIVEDSFTSRWKGKIMSVSFDEESYPSPGYVPEVYYLLTSAGSVTSVDTDDLDDKYDYQHENDLLKGSITQFEKYGTEAFDDSLDYTEDIAKYNTLRSTITNETGDWHKATHTEDNVWSLEEVDNIFAVAIVFNGDYTVKTGKLVLTADLNMKAPDIVSESENNNTESGNNNRVTYNDTHCFALGYDSASSKNYPMYSVSNRTLVNLNHSVELEKVSSTSGKRLSGAKFSVYKNIPTDDDNDLVSYVDFDPKTGKNTEPQKMRDMEVGLDGILKLNLAPGIFYYKETEAPVGFIADTAPYRFRVIADDNAVFYYTVDLKTDSERTDEYLIVNNNEVTNYSYIYSEKTPVGTAEVFHVYDSSGTPVSKFENLGGGKYTYSSSGDELTGDLSFDSTGRIEIKNLPAGSYHIGKAVIDDDKYAFSVADKVTISFRAFKKSAKTSDVEYEVRKMKGSTVAADDELCSFNKSGDTYALNSSGSVTVISPSSDGKLTVNGLDDSSTYYLRITKVPDYFKGSDDPVLTIKNETEFTRYATEQLLKTGRIVVENDPVTEATAHFQKVDIDSASEGNSLVNDAKYNMYIIENDGSETKLYFRYDESSNTYVYSGTSGGEGLTAELTSGMDQDNPGKINVSKLGFGIYYVQESSAPTGYKLDSDKHYFRVSVSTIDSTGELIFGKTEEESSEEGGEGEGAGESTGTDNTMKLLSLYDHEVLSTIELNKTEEADKNKYLGYASYKLFRLKEGKDLEEAKEASANSRGIIDSGDFPTYWEFVKDFSTDIAGQATVRGLTFGTYLLYEDQPPAGYKWNNDSAQWEVWTEKDSEHKEGQVIIINAETIGKNSSIRINDDGSTETVYHTFYALHRDERKTGEARLIKANSSGNALTDGNFTLYKLNFTEAEKTAAIKKYLNKTDTEVAAMTPAERAEDLSKITMTQEDVIVSEHIADGKPKTAGAGDTLIDTPVKQGLKTSSDPSIGATETVSGLDWGVYYFFEVKSPSGYQQDTSPQLFTVSADNVGSTIEVHMTDDKTYGKLWLYKQAEDESTENIDGVDTQVHDKLFGAKFELYTKQNEKVYALQKLRLGRLDDGRQEFIVTAINVVDADTIEFTLKGGYVITANYRTNNAGEVLSVAANEAFVTYYGNPSNTSDFRLTYYTVSKDGSMVYDEDMKTYRELTVEEQVGVTSTYVTADEGGRLCVRGLDWLSYYFRETVPPEGYGLADDVIFTVNSYNCENQFVACEDPRASAAIIIDKEIPEADTEYFDAYGEPTFLFKIHQLKVAEAGDTVDYTDDTGTNYTKTGDSFTQTIHLSGTNGSAMVNVPVGQYLIEEMPVLRYKCTGLELVKGDGEVVVTTAGIDTKTSTVMEDPDKHTLSGNRAFCDLTGGVAQEMLVFRVKYENAISRYDHFSHVSYIDNRIPGREYITAFKPIYTPLVEVKNSSEPFGYVIDLRTALRDNDFEAALSYNTERVRDLELSELRYIAFKSNYGEDSPIQSVSYNRATNVLTVTVRDPVSLAGQSISLDVGYCYSEDFNTYDINNTEMVSGTLSLTFSEVKADVRKRVILRNDVTNKTYFPYADSANPLKDCTSVAVVYVKDAETEDISKIMENADYKDEIKINDTPGLKVSGYYLLNSDGKPVFDKEGKVMLFTRSEIESYIFNGEYPEYLVTDSLLPDGVTNPAKVENINTFTFQAYVEQIKPTAEFSPGEKNAFDNNSFFAKSKLGIDKTSLKKILKGDEAGYNNASYKYQYEGKRTQDYPDDIRFYSNGTDTIYWYTVNPVTGRSTNGEVYVSGATGGGNNNEASRGWFNGCTNLSDISGMSDWDLSGINTSTNKMFAGTKLTDVVFNVPIELSSQQTTSFNRMFYNCKSLKSVSMTVDMTKAKFTQFKETFKGCSSLTNLNLVLYATEGYAPYKLNGTAETDLTNTGSYEGHNSVGQMLDNFSGCNALPAEELIRAIGTWKLPRIPILRFFQGYNKTISTTTEIHDAEGKLYIKDNNNTISNRRLDLTYISG